MYNNSDYTAIYAREAKLALDIESDMEEKDREYSRKEKEKAEEDRRFYANIEEKEKKARENYEINKNNRLNETIKEIPKNINITYIRSGELLSQCNKNIYIREKSDICIDYFTFPIGWIYKLYLSNIFIDNDYCVLIAKNKGNNKYEAYKRGKGYVDLTKVKYPLEIINTSTSRKSKKVWEDLLGSTIPERSSLIEGGKGENFYSSYISEKQGPYSYERFTKKDRSIFYDEKYAKSALAMAQISQLMPYYGKAITDKEWDDRHPKYVILRSNNAIMKSSCTNRYSFLAFHTEEQRDNFLKYNEHLVKDYLMIDNMK